MSTKTVSVIRAVAVLYRNKLATALLAGGWIALLADDLDWVRWSMPTRVHDDLRSALVVASIVFMVGCVVRGPSYWRALHVGRIVERERTRQRERDLMDAPTGGIGVNGARV